SHLSISQQLPRQIQLKKDRPNLVIGSDPQTLGTDIVLRGSGVAPKHAELLFEANNWSVIPLDKEKPVYLNGQQIYDRTLWEEYKTLQIGTHFLRLNLAEETLEKVRSFDLALSASRVEIQPNSKQRVEVVIQNNAKQRGYYQIKAVSPPPSSETGTLIPDGWLNIKHNGTPILPGEQATLPVDIAIPADAKANTYWYAIEADSLATNDGSLTVVGTVVVSTRADFAVQVNSTQLLENQVCWLSITNQGNQEQVFYFTLSDMEQELLFGLVPKDKVPAASSENGRSQPTRSGTPFTIPPAQSALGGFRSLPFLRTFFDPLRQNWLSRWWRRAQSQVRYVRGLGRYLPNAPQPTAQLDQATTPLPPAFFYPQEYYSRVEEGITIASQSTERIGFVVEAKERPFTARYAQNHAFTLNVRAGIHGQENSRAATVTIQPRYSFKATAAVLSLLALLPLLLWLFIALSNSNLRQLRADARAFAALNLDGDSPDNGAEVLLFTDPKYPPATETPTPIPFTTSIAILVPTPPLTPTATLPTQLFSVAGNDGYLVMRGKQVTIFANEPVLHVGDTADNGAARAIVSFDTSAITNDTNIRSVELFLSPVEPTDENAKPIGKVFEELGSYLYADMAPGGFGFDLGLGQGDFSAQTGEIGLQIAQLTMAPNGVQVLLRFGNNQGKVIAALQQHDVVEFRLYFLLPSNEDDSEAQYVLVSGDSTDEEKRPYLEITYGP
ncbi:MAG: FHA domain-containing protein, partial [Chloroflexota bacterium]